MKRFLSFAILAALVSVPAFAAKNAQTVNLAATVTVGSTQVTAGDCKVTWTGAGPEVQVSLVRDGKTLVTFPAKLAEEKHNSNGVTTNTLGGVKVLQSIQLAGVNLLIENNPVSGQ